MIKTFHPSVLLTFFLGILIFIMFSQSIFVTIFAFFSAVISLVLSENFRNLLRSLVTYLLIILLTTITNPIFSHRGQTPLLFLNDTPITLESLGYGAYLGLSIVNCILWLRLLGKAVSHDDVLYLFGKLAPQTALLTSMTMGFIPKIKYKFSKFRLAQMGNGIFAGESKTDKILYSTKIFTALFGWSVESSVTLAQSMKARGYGLSRRSYARIVRFRKSDFIALVAVILIIFGLFFNLASGNFSSEFYPKIEMDNSNKYGYCLVGTSLFLPVVIQVKEIIKWKFYLSRT